MPLEPEVAAELNLDTPSELHQTAVDGNLDIVEVDIFVEGDIDYRVESVGDWPFAYSSIAYKYIVLREVKGEI